MARVKTKTMANYFQNHNINTWNYVKDGLKCWSKSDADFKCRVECPYNERKVNGPCYNEVSKDALNYIVELEEKLANAQEVRRGRWNEVYSNEVATVYECSNCKHLEFAKTDYCICGARMDGEGE